MADVMTELPAPVGSRMSFRKAALYWFLPIMFVSGMILTSNENAAARANPAAIAGIIFGIFSFAIVKISAIVWALLAVLQMLFGFKPYIFRNGKPEVIATFKRELWQSLRLWFVGLIIFLVGLTIGQGGDLDLKEDRLPIAAMIMTFSIPFFITSVIMYLRTIAWLVKNREAV